MKWQLCVYSKQFIPYISIFLTEITYSVNLNKKLQSQMGFTNIKLFLKNRSAAVQFTLKSSTTSLLKKDWRDPLMLIYTDLKISKGNPSPAKWVAFNVLLSQFLPLNASQTFYILRGNRHRIGNMTDSHLYISIQQSKHSQ